MKNEKMLMMLPGPRMADENRTQLYYRFKTTHPEEGAQVLMNVVLVVSVVQVVKSSTIVSNGIALGGNGKGSGLVGRVQVLPNWVSRWALVPYISGMRHPSPHARRVALVPVQLSRSVGYIAHSQGIYLMLQSDGV